MTSRRHAVRAAAVANQDVPTDRDLDDANLAVSDPCQIAPPHSDQGRQRLAAQTAWHLVSDNV